MKHPIRSATTYQEGDSAGVAGFSLLTFPVLMKTASIYDTTTGYDWTLYTLSNGMPTATTITGDHLWILNYAGDTRGKDVPVGTYVLVFGSGPDADGNLRYLGMPQRMEHTMTLVEIVSTNTEPDITNGSVANPWRYDVYVFGTSHGTLLVADTIPIKPRLSAYTSAKNGLGYGQAVFEGGNWHLVDAWETYPGL